MMCLDDLFGGEGAVAIPTENPKTPARSATQRKDDTGSKIKIGTDDDRASSRKKKKTQTAAAGLSIGGV